MAFIESVQNKVIERYQQQHFQLVKGQVKEYDTDSNRAHVYINDPKNGEEILLYNVPVELSGIGLNSAGPFSGDQVYVAFVNGSLVQPKVIGRSDETFNYYTRTVTKHERKGAYLTEIMSDISSFDESTPTISSTTSSSQWVDQDNNSILTYQEYTGNALKRLKTDVKSAPYYALAEIGLTHPLNTSTLKVRDNGIIDAFVGTNCGIRITPNSRTLLFLSSVENHHASNSAFVVDGRFTIEAGGLNRQRSQSYLIQTNVGTIQAEQNLALRATNLTSYSTSYQLTYQTLLEKGSEATRQITNLTENISKATQTYQTLNQEASIANQNFKNLTQEGNNISQEFSSFKQKGNTATQDFQSLQQTVSNMTGRYNSQQIEVGGTTSLKAGTVSVEGGSVAIKGDGVNLDSSNLQVGNGGTITFSGSLKGDFEKEVKRIMDEKFGELFKQHHNNADHSKWM